ncbi:MAG: RNA-binding protein [Gammaproteobacteria bacterium]|nr:RNA-binding protein [Gammaproteobacteria bacterium]
MKKIFVGSLPPEATQDSVTELFSEFGKVRGIELVRDVFSGKCKGFAFVQMEGHEARAAISGLNGKMLGENHLKVKFEEPRMHGRGKRR